MLGFPYNAKEDDIEVVQLFASKIHYPIHGFVVKISISLYRKKVQIEVSDKLIGTISIIEQVITKLLERFNTECLLVEDLQT